MEKEFEKRQKSMKKTKYRPILFNTEMVKAILEGRKTQTRRIIKLTRGFTGRQIGESGNPDFPLGFMYPCGIKRPPCEKGDILYVRETWCDPCPDNPYVPIAYKADMPMHFDAIETAHEEPVDLTEKDFKWKPSIHMPKEYARIFLRVKDVRVERLRDIHEKYEPGPDNPVVKEGFSHLCDFIAVWNSTMKPADRECYGWDANPWVWVIEFERCEEPKEE